MQVQVVKVEIGVLVVGHENIIVAILQTHVRFHDKIIWHKKSEKGIHTHPSHFEELDPLHQLDILVNDFALLEGKVLVGFRTRDLDERLVEVDRVVDIAFQTQQPFERGSQDFRVAQAVRQEGEPFFVRGNHVVF